MMSQQSGHDVHRIRTHLTMTATIAAVMMVALGLVLSLAGAPGGSEDTVAPDPDTPVEPPQTLLVQVGMESLSLASALVVPAGPEWPGAQLSLGSSLLVEDKQGYSSLLEMSARPGVRTALGAVANTLGVQTDHRWQMERKALSGLVDSVGGVTVDVERPLVLTDEYGDPMLSLEPGSERLNGRDASWFVSGFVQDESNYFAQQERFRQVLTGAISAIEESPEVLAQTLTSLGALSNSTLSSSALADYLLRWREDLRSEAMPWLRLPVRRVQSVDVVLPPRLTKPPSDPAISVPTLQQRVVSFFEATPLLREAFPLSPRVAEDGVSGRVIVWIRERDPEAMAEALTVLSDEGLAAVSGGLWERAKLPEQAQLGVGGVDDVTVIYGRGYADNGEAWALQVWQALGIRRPQLIGTTGFRAQADPVVAPEDELPTMPPPNQRPWADVDVVLGTDYPPCPQGAVGCDSQPEATGSGGAEE